MRRGARAQETITPLTKLPTSTNTCCKPQSKLWFHGEHWWAAMPSSSVSPAGTWVWRLEPTNAWTNVLHLSSDTSSHADARRILQLDSSGDPVDVTHILLHGSAPKLASVEYDPDTQGYKPWTVRPTLTPISLPGSETATIDIDSNHRIWLATESGSSVQVFYSDYPYTAFKGPLILADDIHDDDITAVVALPFPGPPKIGVFWSNQNTELFGFRVHPDEADKDPEDLAAWGPDEMPGLSAPRFGSGVGDDHMHLGVASDGTLYASVKTSYNSTGFPVIGLLVRHPDGTWDDLREVDTIGTRPILLLNEPLDLLRVIYTSDTSGGDILYRDSLLSTIGFGARKTLMTGSLNDATSTKENWTDQLVVVASGRGALFRETGVTTTTVSSTTSTRPAGTSSTTTTTASSTSSTTATTVPSTSTVATSTSTSTSLTPPPPGGMAEYQAGVSGPVGSANVDTNVRLSTPTTTYGGDANLYVGVTNATNKVHRTLMAFNLGNIPAGATVTACALTVNVTQRTNPTPGHVRRLCGEHWLDGDAQGEAQATWNVWKTGSAWTVAGAGSSAGCSAGGDSTTAGEVAYTPPAGTGRFTFSDLSALCQDAVALRGGWLRLRISQDAESTQSNLIRFESSDASTATNRPKLSVTWSTPTTTSTSSSTTTTSTTSTSTSITSTTTSSTTTTTPAGTSSTTTTTVTSTSTVATSTSTSTSLTPPPPGGVAEYQAGVNGPVGSANVDTNVRLSTPSTTYGSDANLYVGVTNATDKVYRTLMAFNLGNIPAGATVTACTLTVTVTQRTSPTPGHVRRLCGEHWLDGDAQGEAQATWNVWRTGAAWTVAGAGSTAACSAGGDYTAEAEVPYTPPAGTGRFTFPDFSALCQDAVALRGGWLRLRISQDAESTQSNLIRFESSDASTLTNRPKLSVTWSNPTTSTSTSTTSTSTTSTSTTSTSTSSTTTTTEEPTTTTSTSSTTTTTEEPTTTTSTSSTTTTTEEPTTTTSTTSSTTTTEVVDPTTTTSTSSSTTTTEIVEPTTSTTTTSSTTTTEVVDPTTSTSTTSSTTTTEVVDTTTTTTLPEG